MIEKIKNIVNKLNIPEKYIDYHGKYKAKISGSYYNYIKTRKSGKLILFTAINPTPHGEGKTTQSIGLTMAMNKIGKNSIAVLREPSLGPVFGVKGGAIGGGMAKLLPSEDIDLHFTGDFHAITSSNNLLCAVVDNHIFQGNILNIDPERVFIKRAIDMNDRSLRNITTTCGVHTGFEITAACELMAICCLAENKEDLKEKLGSILVGYTYDNKPIYARNLNVVNAMMALLKEAMNPNLVQTTEHTPCIVHLGPFANIAHGCNSVIATKLGLKLADYCITESGFGADLGAEKFFDIKCRKANIVPDIAILVATVKALKYNGGDIEKDLSNENLETLKKGIVNLGKHIENINKYQIPLIVCINKFSTDTENEVNFIKNYCLNLNVKCEVSTTFENGGEGSIDLAKIVIQTLENSKSNNFKFIYDDNDSIETKINKVCTEIYGASNVEYFDEAKEKIKNANKLGYDKLPICIAKTPLSLSDNSKLLGCPKDFTITVRDIKISSGAGFIVVYAGDIMTMPGLGKKSKFEEFI
ncbi:MAG: formate--tetrahydrofolate ligase [Clostridia bacterium]|nr:formate--tetrahydrofolate ligase [Clostridia bacterium]MDD4387425.1 formate--tetrahydrofolate ligase [Clostridia bacterium]